MPSGRARTPLVVADTAGEVARLELAGNIVPDAFTVGGEGLFVLDWLPATAPDRYRVRQVDVATGRSSALLTRVKTAVPPGAEEEMSGEGRMAVYAPNRQVLYTLYTHQPDHRHTRDLVAGRPGDVHAFVHTLHLAEQWAYCVDLPAPFGEGPGAGHALAINPEGSEFYVADVTSGRFAVVGTEQLAVREAVDGPKGTGTAYAVATFRQVLVAVGGTVHVLPRDGAPVWRSWDAGGEVRGLAASPDGKRVYAALPDTVAWFDAETGQRLGTLAVPGVSALDRVL
ncbi:YncE family protein [Catellatospora coxensis]